MTSVQLGSLHLPHGMVLAPTDRKRSRTPERPRGNWMASSTSPAVLPGPKKALQSIVDRPSLLLRFGKGLHDGLSLSEARAHSMTIRLAGFSAIVLLGLAGCATSRISAPPSLADLIAKVDTAYGNLPSSRPAYNSAVREICAQLETSHPQEFISSLKKLDVGRALLGFACFTTAGVPAWLSYTF